MIEQLSPFSAYQDLYFFLSNGYICSELKLATNNECNRTK